MAAYELRNQQTGKVLARIYGGVRFALGDAYTQLDTDFPIAVWQVFPHEEGYSPLYLCTLIMNSDPKLGE